MVGLLADSIEEKKLELLELLEEQLSVPDSRLADLHLTGQFKTPDWQIYN
jgi:hypothetical protein